MSKRLLISFRLVRWGFSQPLSAHCFKLTLRSYAALKLCRILLSAEGYRPSHELQHYRTLAALPEILGDEKKPNAEYLNDCRKKRNVVEYDDVGGASESDSDELIGFVKEFKDEVIAWLKKNHPELL